MNDDLLKGYIAGLVEGEGCFNIAVQKSRPQFRMPFEIRPVFIIFMHIREKELLEKIKNVLKVGNVFTRKNKSKDYDNTVRYQVSGLKHCKILIRYLDNIEFLGTKKISYQLWKEAVSIIKNDQHRTKEGILRIAKIRDQMHNRNSKDYRDYNWFKNYLDKYYKNYTPFLGKNVK